MSLPRFHWALSIRTFSGAWALAVGPSSRRTLQTAGSTVARGTNGVNTTAVLPAPGRFGGGIRCCPALENLTQKNFKNLLGLDRLCPTPRSTLGQKRKNKRMNKQLEIRFDTQAQRTPSRREQRRRRAQWWFAQMRLVVESAIDWRQTPPARPEQIYFTSLTSHRYTARAENPRFSVGLPISSLSER